MSIVSIVNQATKLQSTDTTLVEKAAWALRQRLRKQMNQLSGSFFDEVDDFIFEAGKLGQLSEGSDYLGAMREIRAKQVIFEESFLDTAAAKLEVENKHLEENLGQSSAHSEASVIFESMEIEIAIATMSRKAAKQYLPYVKQIESLNAAVKGERRRYLIRGNTLVASVLAGFVEAQSTMEIALEIRLVFMKLFEQHFLLKMEKLFLDIISILNNIDNRQFVERLYSSSSSFHVPVADSCTANRITQHSLMTNMGQPKPSSKAVESSVEAALKIVESNPDVPGFVQQMVQDHWRMVLLLIGLNKGVASLEWQEAEHVLKLLALCSSADVERDLFDESLLTEKVSQGLRLLRISIAEEQRFIEALKGHLSAIRTSVSASDSRIETDESAPIEAEATVSPSGQSILDTDDLNEIAQLINGEPVNEDYAENEEKAQLIDSLALVDQLNPCTSVRISIKGKLHNCLATRSGTKDGVFIITNAGSDSSRRKIAITRSRLGLAISIRSGEISLCKESLNSAPGNITVFEKKA